jgi:hypothetical protein
MMNPLKVVKSSLADRLREFGHTVMYRPIWTYVPSCGWNRTAGAEGETLS